MKYNITCANVSLWLRYQVIRSTFKTLGLRLKAPVNLFIVVSLISTPVMADLLDNLESTLQDIKVIVEEPVSEAITVESPENDFDISGEDPVREPFTTLNEPVNENDTLRHYLLAETRYQWGQNFDPKKVIVHHKDVTCDGKKDYVASHINLDNPDGYFFNLIIVTDHEGKERADSLTVPFEGATEQYGLCMMKNNPFAEIYYDVWPPEEINDVLGGMNICPTAIEIVDGMCDSLRFFWSNEVTKGEPRWVFHRY